MDTPTPAELRAFDATAHMLSMSKAAKQLGLRQPTISAHIASLEQRFGVELFHRRGRGLALTEFGYMLREVTSRIHQAEEHAVQLMTSAKCQYLGLVRISAIGPYNVTPIIKAFRHQYPAVQINITMCDSRTIVRRVLDFADDVGLPLRRVDDDRIHCEPYRRQRLVVFAHRDHPLARRRDLSIKDLAGQEFIMREEGSQTRAIVEAGLAAAGVRVRHSLEIGSREGVREAVAQGLGLGVVSENAFTLDNRIVPLNIDGFELYTHVHLVCLAERRNAPLINRFFATANQVSALLKSPT